MEQTNQCSAKSVQEEKPLVHEDFLLRTTIPRRHHLFLRCRLGTVTSACIRRSTAIIAFLTFSKRFCTPKAFNTADPRSETVKMVPLFNAFSLTRPFCVRKASPCLRLAQSMPVSYDRQSTVKGLFFRLLRISSYNSSFDFRIQHAILEKTYPS
jgi:hypothetical protein